MPEKLITGSHRLHREGCCEVGTSLETESPRLPCSITTKLHGKRLSTWIHDFNDRTKTPPALTTIYYPPTTHTLNDMIHLTRARLFTHATAIANASVPLVASPGAGALQAELGRRALSDVITRDGRCNGCRCVRRCG